MKQFNKSIRSKLFYYFSQKLGIKKSTNNWWRCNCIYCDGFHSMGINLSEHRVHCFKCGIKVSPISLVMEMEHFGMYSQVWQFLKIQQEYEAYQESVLKPIEFKQVELPKEFQLITQGDSVLSKCARNYLKKRGYSINQLEKKGVGYCTSGKYQGYIIFPCYQNSNLVFFQGRKFIDIGPKMQNPEIEQFGIGKTKVIFNADALFIYNTIYTVESITNALTLGDRACGNFGKDISPWQLSYYINSPCRNVIIILDPDALDKAYSFAMQLVHYKRVKVIELPKEKDVNDLGKKKTLGYVNRVNWQSYNELLRLKINLNEGSVNTYKGERIGITPTRGY